MVIWMLSTYVRFSSGSTTELANRANSTFSTGSKASQSSTRKMASSGKCWCMVSFSCRELARSVPNGFSTITRAPLARPDLIGHGLIGGLVAEVPVHVPQQVQHLDCGRVVRVHVVELERGGRVV